MTLDELLEKAPRDWDDTGNGVWWIGAAIAGLEDARAIDLEKEARSELRLTPTPISAKGSPELARRRRALAWLAAHLAAKRGEPEELLSLARSSWLTGESPIYYLRLLLAHGQRDYAAAFARLMLSNPECVDRAAIEAVVAQIAQQPDGWRDAVVDFAKNPTVERWEDLMRFVPNDAYPQRARTTIATLVRLGVDPNVVFLCATRIGIGPEAVAMVEEGRIASQTIVERARDAPRDAKGRWLGLAARAAWTRGDRFGAVRLLREAYDQPPGSVPPDDDARRIRDEADAEMTAMLDAAKIPVFD